MNFLERVEIVGTVGKRVVTVQEFVDLRVTQPLENANHRRKNFVARDVAVRVQNHFARHSQTVDARI